MIAPPLETDGKNRFEEKSKKDEIIFTLYVCVYG